MNFIEKLPEELRAEALTEIDNFKKEQETSFGAIVNDRFNKLADSIYEKDLKPIFGVEKLQNEKHGDYVKRAYFEKEKSLKSVYETQISELNEKLKSGATDESLKVKLTETEKKLNEFAELNNSKQSEFEKLKSDYEKQLSDYQLKTEKRLQLPKLSTDENLKYKAIVKHQEFENHLEKEWDLAINEEGEIIAKNKNSLVSKKYTDLAKEYLSDVLENSNTNVFNPAQPQKSQSKLIFPADMKNDMQKANLVDSYIRENHGLTDKTKSNYIELFQKYFNQK